MTITIGNRARTIGASLLGAAILLAAPALGADTSFAGLDLSASGQLLFSAKTLVPGDGSYSALFTANVADGTIAPLTFYPEEAMLVNDGRQLQLRNRFGVFRSDTSFATISAVKGFPSFARGASIQTGKLSPVSSSPDGRFIAAYAPDSFAFGKLELYDLESDKRSVVADGIEVSLQAPPAAWSPDGKFFIYRKGDSIYYYSIDQYRSDRVIDEGLRLIGQGSISSVQWSRAGDLFYASDYLVYRIMPREFFPRSLYAGLISIGTVVGKIPFPFDPNFDSFTVSPDSSSLLLSREGRNLFLFRLSADDYSGTSSSSLPYLYLPRDTEVQRIFWPETAPLTIVTRSLASGSVVVSAYRLNDSEAASLEQKFVKLDATGAERGALSPDESLIALPGPGSVRIRSYSSWRETDKIDFADPRWVLWKSNDEILIAGGRTIEIYSLSRKTRSLVALAAADRFGWFDQAAPDVEKAAGTSGAAATAGAASGAGASAPPLAAGAAKAGPAALPSPAAATTGTAKPALPPASVQIVRALSDGRPYEWNPLAHSWMAGSPFEAHAPSSFNDSFRVYLEDLASGPYRNIVMIRRLKNLDTESLFDKPKLDYDKFPVAEEPNEGGVFYHGSRIRRREVALSFDAVDSVEGLRKVLSVLSDYGLKTTFFLNGEFMRRNPGAVKEISTSGQEVASMFFADFNLTDARYRIDSEFVKRGLARNEDDYFALTGKELALLWHAPFYVTSSDMVSAAREMNYAYIGSDVDPLDWMSSRDSKSVGMYFSAHKIIERIMEQKKPGSIIPIRIGVPAGGRDSYLFNELGLLINSLMAKGYDIVPVSALMERAR